MDTLQQTGAAMEGGALDMQKLIRILLESTLNAIMDEQADMACEGGGTSRNGYRERGLVTPAGKITLRIPKLRCGTYFPDGILERYSRVDKAVAAAVAEMYATGVSTRKVERVAAKLGVGGMSASQVSRICEQLDAEVGDLRAREFSAPTPYLFLDATYVKCRRGGHVRSTAVVTAIAIGEDGVRRVAGLSAIDTETYVGWLGFCRDLRRRGVSGVRCVTSDAHDGLRRAIEECFPGAAWQRCIVHLERNVCSLLKSKRHRKAAGKVMQAVFAESEPAAVRAAYHAAIDAIGGFSPEAAGLLEEAEADALAYLDFRRRLARTAYTDATSRASQRLGSYCLTPQAAKKRRSPRVHGERGGQGNSKEIYGEIDITLHPTSSILELGQLPDADADELLTPPAAGAG